MQAGSDPDDFTRLDPPAFLDERARVRQMLSREPENAARAELEQLTLLAEPALPGNDALETDLYRLREQLQASAAPASRA